MSDVEMTASPGSMGVSLPDQFDAKNATSDSTSTSLPYSHGLASPFIEIGHDRAVPESSTPLQCRAGVITPTIEPMFLTSNWLLDRNDQLNALLLESGRVSQSQTIVFNNLWQRFQEVDRSRDVLHAEKQDLVVTNARLKGECGQANHAFEMQQYLNREMQKFIATKEELVSSLRQQLSFRQETDRQTREYAGRVTAALLTVARAPGSIEAHSLLCETYEAQLHENQRMRAQLDQVFQPSQPVASTANTNKADVPVAYAPFRTFARCVVPPNTMTGGRSSHPTNVGRPLVPAMPDPHNEQGHILMPSRTPGLQTPEQTHQHFTPQAAPTLGQPVRKKKSKTKN